MKSIIFLLFSVLVSSTPLISQTFGNDTDLTVITYNIRLNTADDGVNAWPNRKGLVISLIGKQHPSVFGLQEALSGQVSDIESAFPGFGRVGVGRDDGKEAGEYSPVFYDKHRFKLQKSGAFWLSQTPNVAGSRGWDAACNRVVTWVILNEITSGKAFAFFNTHFDHMGEVARRNSANLLLHAVDSLARGIPVIVSGDFNAAPDSEPIKILTDPLKASTCLSDSKSISDFKSGPFITYTGFKVGGIPGERIDYIFIKRISVVKSHVVLDEHSGEFYPSDHLPVLVHLTF